MQAPFQVVTHHAYARVIALSLKPRILKSVHSCRLHDVVAARLYIGPARQRYSSFKNAILLGL